MANRSRTLDFSTIAEKISKKHDKKFSELYFLKKLKSEHNIPIRKLVGMFLCVAPKNATYVYNNIQLLTFRLLEDIR